MRTYTIDITKTWWEHFTSEAICEDAEVGSEDETLHRVGLLLEAKPIKVMANHLRYELPEELVGELHSQAEWYAWFWGTELAESESENRMMWMAWARGSAAFARKLTAILEAGK